MALSWALRRGLLAALLLAVVACATLAVFPVAGTAGAETGIAQEADFAVAVRDGHVGPTAGSVGAPDDAVCMDDGGITAEPASPVTAVPGTEGAVLAARPLLDASLSSMPPGRRAPTAVSAGLLLAESSVWRT